MFELGLIGYPLNHSFSARFFNEKFEQEGIDGCYCLYPIKSVELLPEIILSHPSLIGMNVTIPYKEEVLRYVDDVSPDASKIGAVNVISILRNPDGTYRLSGDNTDWKGFMESLRPLLGGDVRGALVLGTGGAAKAVTYGLYKLGIHVTFVSRNPEKFISDNPESVCIGYSDVNKERIENNLLIVNTTPVGMYPNVQLSPEIPYRFVTPDHICYDLIYNPEETRFLELASQQGAIVKNGLEMLHLQAKYAWDIWKSNSNLQS